VEDSLPEIENRRHYVKFMYQTGFMICHQKWSRTTKNWNQI